MADPVSTITPLPVSPITLLGWFSGLYQPLIKIARQEYPRAEDDAAAVSSLLTSQIRSSQYCLEDASSTPFFVTHYCTQELATQTGVTLGVDFDEIMQPLDYDVRQWRMVSGRTEVNRMPIDTVNRYRLTLAHGGQIAEVPADWLNIDKRHGQIHLMPNALTSLSATFFTIFALHPMLMRPGMGHLTPLLIHLDYTAGLVRRESLDGTGPYDPAEYPKATQWQQTLVESYMKALERHAAAVLYRKIAPALSRGGLMISVDGLNRSANTQVLLEMANQMEADALGWANTQKTHSIGAGWVFA